MHTNDPDRCPEGRDGMRNGVTAVLRCQGSMHHQGPHYFAEDDYRVYWVDVA
ncbi:hypothetical protein [Nitrospira sp. Nam74]